MKSDVLVFFVNGQKVVEENADPEQTLLTYLRSSLGLPGTKLGCGEGGCGACTVMVSAFNRKEQSINHYSMNACLAPLCSMHGLAVTTVEGIGSVRAGKLHPVQDTISKSNGSQCGFCTPGIVMSMYTLLRKSPRPSRGQLDTAFEGNLCRCTGYRPILEGFNSFTAEFQGCGMGDQCCKNKKQEQVSEVMPECSCSYLPYNPSQEPIFPSELQLSDSYDSTSLTFYGERVTWFRPVTLEELLQLKKLHPAARLVVGNSEVGVEVKFKNMLYPVMVTPTHVPELAVIDTTASGITFGAGVSLTQLDTVLKEAIAKLPECQTRVFSSIVEILQWFAGHQIRNVASIAGNIITASPISDLNPIFLAAGVTLTVSSADAGTRQVVMDEKFFTGYRRTVLNADEVLLGIHIPYTKADEYFTAYKQSQRREDDIAIVNCGIWVLFKENTDIIQDIRLAFGGMAPTTVMAVKTSSILQGQRWDDSLVNLAMGSLHEELSLRPGTPGGMEAFRSTLTTSFFFKFFLSTLLGLQQADIAICRSLTEQEVSAVQAYPREPSQGVQLFDSAPSDQPCDDPVNRPIMHRSAAKQATGEAVYCDDMPPFKDELYLALVVSSVAHANITSIDTSVALGMPGVTSYITDVDVQGDVNCGLSVHDEKIFYTDYVTSQGQVIGAILADTATHARLAAKAVQVKYDILPPIITIEQAIEAESYHCPTRTVPWGDAEAGFAAADHVISGEARCGGQEHFYLETNACIAVPGEEDEMQIYASLQNMGVAQKQVAGALGIPANRVTVHVKRLGGGFGGKESRYLPLLLPVSVAAKKTGRAVRCMLDRDEDMAITGMRHPFLGKYKVGFTDAGVLTAVQLDLYSNAGYSMDLSGGVMERAVLSADNAYRCPNVIVRGHICKTHLPSNTAFRGFGSPQGMFVAETYMTHIAKHLNVPTETIRFLNMYDEGDQVHFSQKVINCNLKRCWLDVMQKSEYERRQEEVVKFNKENRWKKRGISVIPTKFGINFGVKFLNQSGALVHVYTDGSVLLTHGGIEMGQGLHTKMIQVASRVLQIPIDKIYINESATNLVPNTSPTAASVGSDLNGMAVMDACQTIMDRLQPVIKDNPAASWKDWVNAAYLKRISLSATGFYKTPGITYDAKSNTGDMFSYFSYGAGCSEVEIDCLTGDHTVLRTDIVMDVGQSLNPTIDVGQIEGAFVQGYGMFTMEQLRYTPAGFLLTRGPGAYKIPAFGDIPKQFNVTLLKGASNPKAVYSSKAVGEPPLFLASSALFAIRNAILDARREAGINEHFTLNSPCTAEKIRMSCVDQFTQQYPQPEPGSFKPWFVDL